MNLQLLNAVHVDPVCTFLEEEEALMTFLAS